VRSPWRYAGQSRPIRGRGAAVMLGFEAGRGRTQPFICAAPALGGHESRSRAGAREPAGRWLGAAKRGRLSPLGKRMTVPPRRIAVTNPCPLFRGSRVTTPRPGERLQLCPMWCRPSMLFPPATGASRSLRPFERGGAPQRFRAGFRARANPTRGAKLATRPRQSGSAPVSLVDEFE